MKGLLTALGIVAGLFVVNGLFAGSLVPGVSISPYFLQVICLAGINIVLAVSLNLINGFTGQFSIGHAGFMAIGAYASAMFSLLVGRGWVTALTGIGVPEGLAAGGALLVALLIGISEVMVVGYLSSTYREAIAFGILILVLILRPQGLLGRVQKEKV